jgi:hypothetical protein
MLEEPLSCNTAPNRLAVLIWDETELWLCAKRLPSLAVRPRGTHELFTKFGTEPKLEWTSFRGGRSTSVR